jgi:hypothetical protein
MLLPHGLALLICLGGLGLSFSAVGDPLFILLSGVWLFQMALMLAAVLKVGLTSDRRYEPVSSETSPVPVRML